MIHRCFLSLIFILFTTPSLAKITTPEVVKQTVQAALQSPFSNCLNYKVVGVCLWLHCDVRGCNVNTSPKVKHHLPDILVMSYADHETHPWQFDPGFQLEHMARKKIGERILRGNQNHPIGKGHDQAIPVQDANVILMETTVVGNPALIALQRMDWLLLKGQAKPYKFYFHSGGSAIAWRNEQFEVLNPYIIPKLIPGRYEVGQSQLWTWGPIFPRSGFISHSQTGKAAGVAAVRAANIATTSNGFYFAATNLTKEPCQDTRCVATGEHLESNQESLWQRLHPHAETRCSKNITQGQSDPAWASEKLQNTASNQGYAWALWRSYKGCIQRPGKFLRDIEWGKS